MISLQRGPPNVAADNLRRVNGRYLAPDWVVPIPADFYPHQPGTNQNCRNCNNPDQAFLHRQPPWLSYRLILPRLYSPLISAAVIASIVPFGSVASAAWIHSFRSASALPLSSPSAYTGLVYLPIRNIVLFQLLLFSKDSAPAQEPQKAQKPPRMTFHPRRCGGV